MNKYVSRGLWTVLVTGGFMALGVGVAHADSGTSGEDGVASGTHMQQPLAIAVIGGFSVSTLLLLFALPMLYGLVHRD